MFQGATTGPSPERPEGDRNFSQVTSAELAGPGIDPFLQHDKPVSAVLHCVSVGLSVWFLRCVQGRTTMSLFL